MSSAQIRRSDRSQSPRRIPAGRRGRDHALGRLRAGLVVAATDRVNRYAMGDRLVQSFHAKSRRLAQLVFTEDRERQAAYAVEDLLSWREMAS